MADYPAIGQQTMANSNSVVIASNQTAVPVTQNDSEMGLNGAITAFRDVIVAQRTTTLADSLADGINTFWTQTVANGGTITSAVGEGQLKTSTAVNGAARLTSTIINYYPGQVNWMNGVLRFGDTGVAGNIRRVGMFTVSGDTPQEGFFFELNGTAFNIVYVKAGVATTVASTAFSKFSTAPYTLDGNYTGYEIRYSGNTVSFYIGNVLRHQISGTTTPLTSTLALPITIQNIKTSGATDITFGIRNIGNGSFGHPSGRVDETGMLAIPAMAVGGGTPHDSVDSGSPLKIGGYAKTAAPTSVADGDRVNAWFNQSGAQAIFNSSALPVGPNAIGSTYQQPHAISTYSPSNYVSATLEASAIVKASGGNAFTCTIYNSKASAQYIQLYNSASLPANGVVPFLTYYIGATTTLAIDFPWACWMSAGIVIGNSSTGATKTIGAADCLYNIQYM